MDGPTLGLRLSSRCCHRGHLRSSPMIRITPVVINILARLAKGADCTNCVDGLGTIRMQIAHASACRRAFLQAKGTAHPLAGMFPATLYVGTNAVGPGEDSL